MYKIKLFILTAAVMLSIHHSSVAQEESTTSNAEDKSADSNWRISASVGYGTRIADFDMAKENLLMYGFDSEAVDDYIKSIKQGYKISGQVHYMFWKDIGLGVNYNFFHSSASIEGYIRTGGYMPAGTAYLKIDDNVFTSYVGPSVFYKSTIGQSNFILYCQFSSGYMMYRNEVLYGQNPNLITGNSFGLDNEIGVEYFITPQFSVGGSFSYFYSVLSKVKIDDGYEESTIELSGDEKENLSRLDASISVNYYF